VKSPSWQRFWWPKVDTPENAASAARNGGVAFGFIALAYAISLIRTHVVLHRITQHYVSQAMKMQPSVNPHHDKGFYNPIGTLPDPLPELTVIGLVVVLIAALLAWRTYKRPSLLLCTIALVWVLLDFVRAAMLWGVLDDDAIGVGIYVVQMLGVGICVVQILGVVAGLGGVRGAWAARRFRQSPPEVVV
jgi:hypothetical protein